MMDISDIADGLAALFEQAGPVAGHVGDWLAAALDKTPALALGLLVPMALLPLAVLGHVLPRRMRGRSPRTGGIDAGMARTRTATSEAARWPADAWIELAGGKVHWIGRRMVRLGRDEDNEIRLGGGTVHRHHALIHRNEDAEFMIQDLSSADGNGVVVNGRRVGSSKLRNGDQVELGEAVMTFHLQPA